MVNIVFFFKILKKVVKYALNMKDVVKNETKLHFKIIQAGILICQKTTKLETKNKKKCSPIKMLATYIEVMP